MRRAKSLVRLLSDDRNGSALLEDSDALLTRTLNARLDGLAAKHAAAVTENVANIKTVKVDTLRVTTTGKDVWSGSRQLETHAKDIDLDIRKTINGVKEGVGLAYYAHRVRQLDSDANKPDVRLEVAALLRIRDVVTEIEATANEFVREQLTRFAVEIKNTTGATRDAYRKVQEQTSAPEALTVELRDNERAATKSGEGEPLPTFEGHIYSDNTGQFPVDPTKLEKEALTTEIARPSFVAWYRNPQRATANSVRIPYRDDARKWASLQIDFLIISRGNGDTLTASIVDPHSAHLADAKIKLRALADFAELHGHRFARIQALSRVPDGTIRLLDLLDVSVREAVRAFEGGEVSALYQGERARVYETSH